MSQTSSVMRLHLSCRIWIAEMNFDINVLRIFDDYLKELSVVENEPEVKNGIAHFEKQFIGIRKDIDELRHEMHIIKMKLGAYSREKKPLDNKAYQNDNQSDVENRYVTFKKAFNMLRNDFTDFEGKWLQ